MTAPQQGARGEWGRQGIHSVRQVERAQNGLLGACALTLSVSPTMTTWPRVGTQGREAWRANGNPTVGRTLRRRMGAQCTCQSVGSAQSGSTSVQCVAAPHRHLGAAPPPTGGTSSRTRLSTWWHERRVMTQFAHTLWGSSRTGSLSGGAIRTHSRAVMNREAFASRGMAWMSASARMSDCDL